MICEMKGSDVCITIGVGGMQKKYFDILIQRVSKMVRD